jgi:hypothetical protein
MTPDPEALILQTMALVSIEEIRRYLRLKSKLATIELLLRAGVVPVRAPHHQWRRLSEETALKVLRQFYLEAGRKRLRLAARKRANDADPTRLKKRQRISQPLQARWRNRSPSP